jgi:hypothetical protein
MVSADPIAIQPNARCDMPDQLRLSVDFILCEDNKQGLASFGYGAWMLVFVGLDA